MDSQHSIRLRIKSAEHNVTVEEKFVANLQQDLATRTPTRGDNFTMTINGNHYDERVEAGRQLVFIGAALKPMQSSRKIGSVAGFPISLHRLDARIELRIHGKNTYQATVSDSPQGTIGSLEHALGEMESQQADSEENLKRLGKRIGELKTQLDVPFEHQEKLESAEKRQQEIIAALDLSKNQASTQVDEQAETETESLTTARSMRQGVKV